MNDAAQTNLLTYGLTDLALLTLKEIIRAYIGEHAINLDRSHDAELEHLWTRGLVENRPMGGNHDHFAPTDLALEIASITYPPGIDSEPRNADCAIIKVA